MQQETSNGVGQLTQFYYDETYSDVIDAYY